MHPVEILLPLRDNSRRLFAAEKYAEVRQTGGGDGARRDCRVRSHDTKRWTRVVEELPNSVGAGLPAG
jgi:hypothetical protein